MLDLDRGRSMTGDRCITDRELIEMTSAFFLPPQHRMFIAFSMADGDDRMLRVCLVSIHGFKSAVTDWGMLRFIDWTELSVTGQWEGGKDRGGRYVLMVSP